MNAANDTRKETTDPKHANDHVHGSHLAEMIAVVESGIKAEAAYKDDPYNVETFPSLNALAVNLAIPRYHSDHHELVLYFRVLLYEI